LPFDHASQTPVRANIIATYDNVEPSAPPGPPPVPALSTSLLGERQKQIYREGTHTAPILECGDLTPLLFFSGRLKKQKRPKKAALQRADRPSREAELPNHYLLNQCKFAAEARQLEWEISFSP